MLEKLSSGDNIGVIIFEERAGRGVLGSIKNPTFHIWIQKTMTRRRIGEREKVRRSRR